MLRVAMVMMMLEMRSLLTSTAFTSPSASPTAMASANSPAQPIG